MGSSTVLNYQRYPELLKPYEPDNSLRVPSPTQIGGSHSPSMFPMFATSQAALPKARIPLPAEGPLEPQSQNCTQGMASRDQAEAFLKPPSSVDIDPNHLVGRLIDQFDSPQRRGRCGRRGRIDPEEQRRSRSVDSSSQSSKPSSLSAVWGIRGETPGGSSVPGSPRARLSAEEMPTLAYRRDESKSPTPTFRGQREKEPASPRAVKVVYRVDKPSLSVPTNPTDESADDRDIQVTPDLLKGWQELLPQPNEDTTKHILYSYLKDGTTDNDSTTQKKVNLVFDKISQLKWKTAERVEEENKDFAAEAEALQEKGAALEREVSALKKRLEEEIVNEKSLAGAYEKAKVGMKSLQEDLEKRQNELALLRQKLVQMETELQTTKEELVQLKAERDKSRMEMKDLQQQLSEMHDELDHAKKTEADKTEDEALLKDMAQLRLEFQEVLQVQEEQEEVLHWRERELTALKGALKEEVESHDQEMASLKGEFEQEVEQLRKALDEAKERSTLLGQEKGVVEEERDAARELVTELAQEREQLTGQVQDLERKVEQLSHMIQETRALENQLEDRTNQLKREKQEVEETLQEVIEKEERMCQANQALAVRLEHAQSELTKLNHEHRDEQEKLKEERKETEALRKKQMDLEKERRMQDRSLEQLQRKMNDMVLESETSTERLQARIDEAKEQSARGLAGLHRQLQEKGVELEKSRQTAKTLQEELSLLEADLKQCHSDREEAQERGRQLEQKVEELEESGRVAQEEQAKQVKLLEGRMGQLEEDLSEERASADLLMNRVEKGREQLEKMRSELLQERAVRQDLECDKITLERQNKDLKSRVSHLEGSQKANQDGLVSKLSVRIQELEERLQGEERDNSNLQQANRKLERKVKEMVMQTDEEHLSLQTQKDQLTQRLKTAKRQMDEAEEEIERLEHAKKKLQRELDEQAETNEELQSQLHALRNDMRRKAKSAPLTMIVEDNLDDVDDCISD